MRLHGVIEVIQAFDKTVKISYKLLSYMMVGYTELHDVTQGYRTGELPGLEKNGFNREISNPKPKLSNNLLHKKMSIHVFPLCRNECISRN